MNRWSPGRLAALLAICACSPHPAHQPAAAPTGAASSAPQATASGLPPITVHSHGNAQQPVRIVESQGNRKLYELLAHSTESTMQSQSEFRGTFSQTHVTFYAKDGTTLIGDAPLATIDKATQRITMQGGVIGKTSDGATLRCDELQYDRSTGRLHGIGNVRIVYASQGYSLTGGSFTSDLSLTHVHMQ